MGSHYVYNRQWRCLWGNTLADDPIHNDIMPAQAVEAYLASSKGELLSPPLMDRETGIHWFLEKVRGKEYARAIVRCFDQEWPQEAQDGQA